MARGGGWPASGRALCGSKALWWRLRGRYTVPARRCVVMEYVCWDLCAGGDPGDDTDGVQNTLEKWRHLCSEGDTSWCFSWVNLNEFFGYCFGAADRVHCLFMLHLLLAVVFHIVWRPGGCCEWHRTQCTWRRRIDSTEGLLVGSNGEEESQYKHFTQQKNSTVTCLENDPARSEKKRDNQELRKALFESQRISPQDRQWRISAVRHSHTQ